MALIEPLQVALQLFDDTNELVFASDWPQPVLTVGMNNSAIENNGISKSVLFMVFPPSGVDGSQATLFSSSPNRKLPELKTR